MRKPVYQQNFNNAVIVATKLVVLNIVLKFNQENKLVQIINALGHALMKCKNLAAAFV